MPFDDAPPLGLYVHLPWCERKCPYCDFNSYQADEIPERACVDALLEDLEQDLPLAWGRRIESIFIGGGTPSLFSAAAIDRLLSGLRALTNFAPAIEITLESNPGSAEAERYRGYRAAGVNRLSIGVQSFADEQLQKLGRVHDSAEARAAFALARAAGFDNINIDLMFGLPAQSPAAAVQDLAAAIALGPEHISWYQLTIEPNTLFHARPPAGLPDDETAWRMQERGQASLDAAGYAQYEVSAYGRPGKRCLHNLNYWRFGDYLGIGAGAHGKLTLPAENRVVRRLRQRQPRAWLEARGGERIAEQRVLDEADLAFEFMLNALRLKHGFESRLFRQRTGMGLNRVLETVQRARARGLLAFDGEMLLPTETGYRHLNELQGMFLDPDSVKKPLLAVFPTEIMHNGK